jgi:tetratricopeptide (TPR) repeat protein
VFRLDRFPDEWASVQNDLGVAYARLGGADHQLNVQRALRCFGLALLVRTEEEHPLEWAATQVNLGNTYRRLHGSTPTNSKSLSDAIEAHKGALRIYISHGRVGDSARVQVNLANSYQLLHQRSGVAQHLHDAIVLYEEAVESFSQQNQQLDRATALVNLGAAYEERGDRESLNGAVNSATEAAAIFEALNVAELWAGAQSNLGSALMALGEPAKAAEAFQAALEVQTPEADALECRKTLINIGDAYYQTNEWESALRHYQDAIGLAERMLGESVVPASHPDFFKGSAGLIEKAVSCAMKIDQPEVAFALAQQGKARLLSNSVSHLARKPEAVSTAQG